MSSCAPWDCSGLGSRLTLSPAVTCLLAVPQPMLTFFIRPPRPCPGTPEECRSAVVLGCCTPAALLFITKEFPCAFGPRNLALFGLSPIRFWLLCCWNWPIQELGWQSFPIPNRRSGGEGLIFVADLLGRWQDIDCRSFSGPLPEDWEEFWPEEKQRKIVYNCCHLSALKVRRYLWKHCVFIPWWSWDYWLVRFINMTHCRIEDRKWPRFTFRFQSSDCKTCGCNKLQILLDNNNNNNNNNTFYS